MSVVIKGMIKPKDCGYCQFCIEEDVMFETEFRCSITGMYMDEDHCFPDICPIVELPGRHGRLIDEDEIIVPSLSSWADQAIVADAIQDAPTIIEAEGDSYQDD